MVKIIFIVMVSIQIVSLDAIVVRLKIYRNDFILLLIFLIIFSRQGLLEQIVARH